MSNIENFYALPTWARIALFRLAERNNHHWAEAVIAHMGGFYRGFDPQKFSDEERVAAWDAHCAEIRRRAEEALTCMSAAELERVVAEHPAGPCGGIWPSVDHTTATGRTRWGWRSAEEALFIEIHRPSGTVARATVREDCHQWEIVGAISAELLDSSACHARHAAELRDYLALIGRPVDDLNTLVDYLYGVEARSRELDLRAARRQAVLRIDPLRHQREFDAALALCF